jgi:pilus assembly protein Flp/PilA
MLYLPLQEGQGLVEYALVIVLVAVVVIATLALIGPAIGNIFSNVTRGV